MLTEEKLTLNYSRWIDGLKKYGCYSKKMIEEIGEQIKDASFALQESSGCAYQGSMINVVLNHLCKLALKINDNVYDKHPMLKVNTNMLMRVLLLQHIAKSEMFILQPNQWKAKNGYIYDFNTDLSTCLKCGERSLFLCMKYGIELNEEEYEAIRIIDKEDMATNPYISPLSQLVKNVNQMVTIELHRTFEMNKQKEVMEE